MARPVAAAVALACAVAGAALGPGRPARARPVAFDMLAPGEADPARLVPPDRATVERYLAARRARNLAVLHDYRGAGAFVHTTATEPRYVWRDAGGHLAAVAKMLDATGDHELLAGVVRDLPDVRLRDVTGGGLFDWMLTSGLTRDELDRIQQPVVGRRPRRGEDARTRARRDAAWRAREDARLARVYAAVEDQLAHHRAAGLAAATDALMHHPVLARRVLGARF